jgi:hypothetical protein
MRAKRGFSVLDFEFESGGIEFHKNLASFDPVATFDCASKDPSLDLGRNTRLVERVHNTRGPVFRL